MAKKKKTIELSQKNITYEIDKQSYKIIRFMPLSMTVDIMVSNDGILEKGIQNIPFAHLPKSIKKIVKPN
ncbi:MAG: hypothetical protein U9N02_03350 [Campylobacterota bacterium]|nr:hypothetical protein [Campylobacterota bacterium]